ncbi:MAG: single-stranded DNA-binding protein [Akkermansia sp.]|nr:single-stranded DNA-binding protein [Akkermansia sp.]MCD8071476.1 single-stranded DNA-binding protein [Akkermansiaceae bacterium]
MAANYNRVILMGNLVADPEVRTTPKGTQVCELRMAINRFIGGDGERREETTFLDVTCWGRTAEIAGQYLSKGRAVFIEGRIQMDVWDDKTTGQKRSRLRIVAENLQMLGSPRDAASSASRNGVSQGGYGGAPYAQPQRSAPQPQAPPAEDFDDDIPF